MSKSTSDDLLEEIYNKTLAELMDDLPPVTAYGVMFDATENQNMAASCDKFNKRSIRHAAMTEEERKQDDYDEAWNAMMAQREIDEEVERKRYRGHHVEKRS